MRRLALRVAVAIASLGLELVGAHLLRSHARRADPTLDPMLN